MDLPELTLDEEILVEKQLENFYYTGDNMRAILRGLIQQKKEIKRLRAENERLKQENTRLYGLSLNR